MNTDEHFTSRRRFLGSSFLGLLGLITARSKLFASEAFPAPNYHPSLFFSVDDLPRIRENTKLPLFKDFWNSLVQTGTAADAKFLKEELDVHNHVVHLLRADEILKRSAFVGLIGENKEQKDLARIAIEKILSFHEWDYFLEGGTETIGLQRAPETTMAMSFAYDWLYDDLSKPERDEILNAIARKGAPPCYLTLYGMRYPDRVKGWGFNPTSTYKLPIDLSRWPIILDRTNLKMIPIAGLTIGSVLLYDREPEAVKWLSLARESLEKFATLYGSDGSYLEGVSYWYYTTLHFAMAVDILKRLQDVDERHLINFPGTMRFALQMQMPSHNYPDDVVNFSDAAASTDVSVGFWVAREFKDSVALYTSQSIGAKRNIFALIWNDRSIGAKDPPESLNDVKFENEWIVSRSGWGMNDTVIAMRSGGPSNHEHADRNSVIVKAYGERLLHDPYGAAYPYTEKHWLLRLTEAHTAALVDGKGHQYHDGHEGTNPSQAVARVVQYKAGEKMSVFTSDATPAYQLVNDDVRKVQRTVAFVKPDIVVLIDEFEKERNLSQFQARFQAFNADGKAKLEIGPDGKSFEILRPNARLSGRVICESGFRIRQAVLDVPAEKGIFPYIETSTDPLKKCTFITICLLSPIPVTKEPKVEILRANQEYRIQFNTEKSTGTIGINLGNAYPVAQLEGM